MLNPQLPAKFFYRRIRNCLKIFTGIKKSAVILSQGFCAESHMSFFLDVAACKFAGMRCGNVCIYTFNMWSKSVVKSLCMVFLYFFLDSSLRYLRPRNQLCQTEVPGERTISCSDLSRRRTFFGFISPSNISNYRLRYLTSHSCVGA